VSADLDAFGLGLWFGATGPMVIHVANSCFPENVAWIRIPISLVALVGVFGFAGTIGATWTNAYTFGMFSGFAFYGICVWIYLRKAKRDEYKKPN
jgi:hypothetical protein